MSGIRGMMKDGWHPKGKDGGKESWRGDFKGINQVAGWMGKGKDSSSADEATAHVSRPLATLKDPSSFGPPPRRVNGAAAASESNGMVGRGSGASVLPARQSSQHEDMVAELDSGGATPPLLPYRQDRTGLTTNNLPPPPARRTESPSPAAVTPKPRPGVPPRLPARSDSNSTMSPSLPSPPSYSESEDQTRMNQGAMSRLGQAGVSVPALGIGRADPVAQDHSTSSPARANNHVNELQSRFSQMSTSRSQSSPSMSSDHVNNAPPNGTTVAEKQAAVNTAQNFRKDPSSVSVSDARKTASVASNFRERHGDQIDAGKRKLSAFNQKYRITGRINDFIEDQKSPANPSGRSTAPVAAAATAPAPVPPPHPTLNRVGSNVDMEALNRRKPPPPPPPAKKPSLQSTHVNSSSPPPPPLPLGTKPR